MKPFSESGLILLYAVLLSCGYCCCCCAHRFSQQSALGFVQPSSSVHHTSTFDTSHVTYTASCSSYTTNPAINRGKCNNIIGGLYAKKKKNKGTGGKGMEEDMVELKEEEEEDGVNTLASVEALQANEEAVETTVTITTEEEVGSDDNREEEAKDGEEREEESEEMKLDKQYMQMAINMATSGGGERGSHGPFPKPICGAVLVAKDGRVSCNGMHILYIHVR